MEKVAPELLCFVAYLGVLNQEDTLELAYCSKKTFNAVLGSEWAVSKVHTLKGLEWCALFGNQQSVKACLRHQNSKIEKQDILVKSAINNPKALSFFLAWCADKEHFLRNLDTNSNHCDHKCERFNDKSVFDDLMIHVSRHDADMLEMVLRDGRADPSLREILYYKQALVCCERAVQLLLEDGRANPARILSEHRIGTMTPKSLYLFLTDGRVNPLDDLECFKVALEYEEENVETYLAWCANREHFDYNLANQDSICNDECYRIPRLVHPVFIKCLIGYSKTAFYYDDHWREEHYLEQKRYFCKILRDGRLDPSTYQQCIAFAAKRNIIALEVLLMDSRLSPEVLGCGFLEETPYPSFRSLGVILTWCKNRSHFQYNLHIAKSCKDYLCDESCTRFEFTPQMVKLVSRINLEILDMFLGDTRINASYFSNWTKQEIVESYPPCRLLIREYLKDPEWGQIDIEEIFS